jgi:hypothetical protein
MCCILLAAICYGPFFFLLPFVLRLLGILIWSFVRFYLVLLVMLHDELLWLCFQLLLLNVFPFLGVSPKLSVEDNGNEYFHQDKE